MLASSKLPWAISFLASTALTLAQNHYSNTYQASVDGNIYSQTGNLRMLLTKPEDGMGGLILLGALVGSVSSLYKLLEPEEIETNQPSRKTAQPSESTEKETSNPSKSEATESVEEAEQSEQSRTAQVEPAKSAIAKSETPALYQRVWDHKKRHLLIPAETGAGKTTLLLGLMQYFWKESNESVEFYGSTAKRSPWLGLEFEAAPDGKPRIINLDVVNPRSVSVLIGRLRWLQKRMQQRQEERAKAEAENKPYAPNRIVLIVDEWNSTLALAKRFDKILHREFNDAKAAKETPLPPQPYAVDELQSLMESILLMGREDECAEWIFGQDHQVQNCGFNTGYQKSFGVLVPFRKGAMQALEQALIGRSPVLPNAIGRKILEEGYAAIKEKPEAAFIYSNLNGHEILEVPYLPNIKREKLLNGTEPGPTATTTTEQSATTTKQSEDPWEEQSDGI